MGPGPLRSGTRMSFLLCQMGLINIFQLLSTLLQPALLINLSNIKTDFWGLQESNTELSGEKQECCISAMQSPNKDEVTWQHLSLTSDDLLVIYFVIVVLCLTLGLF